MKFVLLNFYFKSTYDCYFNAIQPCECGYKNISHCFRKNAVSAVNDRDMTSGTSSPTPTDSPSLSQRPLLTKSVQISHKKTVEFNVAMSTHNDADEAGSKAVQDPERSDN